MAKFSGAQFFQVCKDAAGKDITNQVNPTEQEIEDAIQRRTRLVPKEKPVTLKDALLLALRNDLSQQSGQGRVPDPHEDKKYEIFELIKKIVRVEKPEEEIHFTTDEIKILEVRSEKSFLFELYGFIYDVLEGKNEDFKLVTKNNEE